MPLLMTDNDHGQLKLSVAESVLCSTWCSTVQVVHNDIKSKNILLTKDAAVAKIADVGTSRILETTACSLSAPVLYTWCYAAPEQIKGSRGECTVKVSPPERHTTSMCFWNQTLMF